MEETHEVKVPYGSCNHGVTFDPELAKGLTPNEVQERWPRLDGVCPKGCGFNGVAYHSWEHLYMGDW